MTVEMRVFLFNGAKLPDVDPEFGTWSRGENTTLHLCLVTQERDLRSNRTGRGQRGQTELR